MILNLTTENFEEIFGNIIESTAGYVVNVNICNNSILFSYETTKPKKKKTIEVKLENMSNAEKIFYVKKLIENPSCTNYISLDKILAGDTIIDITLMGIMGIDTLQKNI